MASDKLDITQLTSLHDAVIPYFNKLWIRGLENERYYSADPFDDQQKESYADQNRLPFSVSSIPHKLNTIISTERQNRAEWKATPILDFIDSYDSQEISQQILEKELKAAIASTRLKTIARTNKMKFVSSDIFASGVAVIYGGGEVYVDSDAMGNKIIKLRDIDYKNLMWDRNALDYERNQANWTAKRDFLYRIDVQEQWGKKVAQKVNLDTSYQWASRDKQQYYVQYNKQGKSDFDLIAVFSHYQKTLRDYYHVVFNGKIIAKERKKKDAEQLLRMLQIPYLSQGIQSPPADVIRVPEQAFDCYKFTYTDILDIEETDLTLSPFSIYQAFQFKDRIWTMSDILKSMQQLANRMLSQIDYAFGVDIKNVYEIVVPYLEGTGYTLEEAIKMMRTKGFVPTNRPGAINAIKSQGANPQWIQVMQIMLGLIDEIGGGKTFSGNPNSNTQSGKAINALIGQGELLTTAFIDNRNRWQADLATKVMQFMKLYDNTPYIIKTEAGALTPAMIDLLTQNNMYIPSAETKESGYVKMNAGNNYLEDTEYEMTVEMEDMSANKKEQEFALMVQQEQADPDLLLAPTWRRKKLSKIANITYEEREKIIAEIAQAKQQQAQQAQQMQQEQMNLERAKILISDKGTQTQTVGSNGNSSKNK